jgi:hypothetical protein
MEVQDTFAKSVQKLLVHMCNLSSCLLVNNYYFFWGMIRLWSQWMTLHKSWRTFLSLWLIRYFTCISCKYYLQLLFSWFSCSQILR